MKPVKKEAYKAAPQVAWRRVDAETVILDLDSSDYYALNESGRDMWELLVKGRDPETVARAVARESGARVETVRRDLARFVASLLRKGLLLPAKPR